MAGVGCPPELLFSPALVYRPWTWRKSAELYRVGWRSRSGTAGVRSPASRIYRPASSRSENTRSQLREAGASDSAGRPLQPCRALLRRPGRFRDGLPDRGARRNRRSIGAFRLRSQNREGCPSALQGLGYVQDFLAPPAGWVQVARISCPQDDAPQDKNQKLAGGKIAPPGDRPGLAP